jgi:hypothetical protein
VKSAFRRIAAASVLSAALAAAPAFAQVPSAERVPVRSIAQAQDLAALEGPPDANRTRDQLNEVLNRHAPALRKILALDPTLLSNQAYLASYPGISAFLAAHPDVARNPVFYLGSGEDNFRREPEDKVFELWTGVLAGMAAFLGVSIAVGLITWLIRTLIDYRRWSRLSKVQAEVHTKLLDRFSSNEELMAYIQSPAGAKFLESSPIKLDPGPRSLGAPMGRILWSIQGGVVLICAGIGLLFISRQAGAEAAQAIQSFAVLALALGMGFVVSAIISYGIARKLGLIDAAPHASTSEPAGV